MAGNARFYSGLSHFEMLKANVIQLLHTLQETRNEEVVNLTLHDIGKTIVLEGAVDQTVWLPSVSAENNGSLIAFIKNTNKKVVIKAPDNDGIDGPNYHLIYSDGGIGARLELELFDGSVWAVKTFHRSWRAE